MNPLNQLVRGSSPWRCTHHNPMIIRGLFISKGSRNAVKTSDLLVYIAKYVVECGEYAGKNSARSGGHSPLVHTEHLDPEPFSVLGVLHVSRPSGLEITFTDIN